MINSMLRKFGRVKTIKFFCKKPFEFTYAQSRDMYEQAINLFYVDSKVEKKAMRNLKAEQLEEAAEMVREMATKPEDFEVYGKLMKLSAEIRQLNLPDPPEVPCLLYTSQVVKMEYTLLKYINRVWVSGVTMVICLLYTSRCV